MEYSILEFVEEIYGRKILLPALQRGLVWDAERIEFLFDSLVRKYPIGSFLLWEVSKDTANNYVFYEFIDDYSEKDGGTKNEIAISKEKPTQKDKIIGVIDGQQRLSALYIGLHGKYKMHIPYQSWYEDDGFASKELYVNLFGDIGTNEQILFRFLTDDDSKEINSKGHELWYKVKDLIKKGITTNDEKKNAEIQTDLEIELGISTNKSAKAILITLINSLTKKDLLKSYSYGSEEIEDVLEAFVRTNNQGKPLSKADLIFSTIVSDNPDFRETIESYLKVVNSIGNNFEFNKDFILKACQMVVNKTPKNDIKSIKGKTSQIYLAWDNLSDEITYVVKMLSDLGFNRTTITANNAVLPIIYYREKIKRDFTPDEVTLFYNYLICSFIKGVFGGSSDNVLQNMMNEIEKLINDNKTISMDWLKTVQLKNDGVKTFAFTEDEIKHILDTYKKGSAGAHQVLLLLYNNLRFKDRYFHEDHIHASALFNKKRMKELKISISENKLKEWQEKCNLLPNLQLLEKIENIKKQDELYEIWYANHPDIKDRYIDYGKWSLKLEDFDDFFQNRYEKMFNQLKSLLVF